MNRTAFARNVLVQTGVTIVLMVGAIVFWETLRGAPAGAQSTVTAAPAKAVVTESLTIVDAQGRPRATLGAAADGTGLRLLDDAGKVRLSVRLEPSGAAVVAVNDKSGAECTTVGVQADGGAGLLLKNAAGKNRAYFSLLADGSAGAGLCDNEGRDMIDMGLSAKADEVGMAIKNAAGKPRFWFGVDPTGGIGMEFLDAEGKAHVAMGTETGKGGGMILADEKGRPRVSMWAGANGGLILAYPDDKPAFALMYPAPTTNTVGLEATPAPSAYMYDTDGKRVWSAP